MEGNNGVWLSEQTGSGKGGTTLIWLGELDLGWLPVVQLKVISSLRLIHVLLLHYMPASSKPHTLARTHTHTRALDILLRGQYSILLRGFSPLSPLLPPPLKSSSPLLPSVFAPPSQVLKHCFIKSTLTPPEEGT